MTTSRRFLLFKLVVYSLLAVNMVLFFRTTSFHEGMDSVGWLMLLGLFEWETRPRPSTPPRFERYALNSLEVLAYSFILYAWTHYAINGQTWDLINASLWLAVVLLIELDIRLRPQHPWRNHPLHMPLKGVLYVGLIIMAIGWSLRGDALNGLDAALWIICFFAIEMNIFKLKTKN